MADNKETILCPACKKEMKKVFLPDAGINVDVCIDGCGGIYLDNQEYKRVDEQHEDVTPILDILENRTFETVDEQAQRICPYCGAKMVKNYSSALHQVQIDECYSCGGKFLDNNELQKIRAEFTTEKDRAEHFTAKLYDIVGKNYENKVEF